jgi:hypothetical protein
MYVFKNIAGAIAAIKEDLANKAVDRVATAVVKDSMIQAVKGWATMIIMCVFGQANKLKDDAGTVAKTKEDPATKAAELGATAVVKDSMIQAVKVWATIIIMYVSGPLLLLPLHLPLLLLLPPTR